MIKVLMIAKAMERTGVTNVMLSYFDFIDKNQIHIDFATGSIYEDSIKKHIEDAGGLFWVIPNRDKNLLAYVRRLARLIRENGYDVVHVHGNSGMIFPELMAAKMGGTKVRIAHSHNTMCNHPKLEPLVRPLFEHYYTDAIACSKEAGKWMFKNKPFKIINNGTDTSKMAFSETDRHSAREELGISDDTIVVGHIGYFNYQKNHPRLIEIYRTILQKNNNTKLLLIGDGGNRSNIEKMVQSYGISDKVIFYGQSNNVARLLSAIDVLVLPSNFEGTPIVLLEAQSSGMKCVTSADFPEDASIAVMHLSLEENNVVWASKIIQAARENWGIRTETSRKYRNYLKSNKYDAQAIGQEMSRCYFSALKK